MGIFFSVFMGYRAAWRSGYGFLASPLSVDKRMNH